ncbi:MAG: apolipoprotein N-acyltransferase [Actinomycetota bacterium]|nr:apolipoprotein N-acyltransferase [Actinomycetota bacterium]
MPWPAVGLAFAGGLGLDAAFAPLQWWPAAVPATAAIVLAVRGRSWRAGLLIGFAAGLGEFLPLLSWLHVVTPAAWIALALISSVYVAALGGALAVVVGKVPGWPAWVACLWVGEELVRDRWPLGGFSWGRLAFSQPNTPFTRFAALGGAPLVTFAVALAAALLAAAVWAVIKAWPERLHRSAIARVVVTTLAVVGVPLIGLAVPRPTTGTAVQVAVIQGNVPRPGTHFLGEAEQVLDNHLAETAALTAKVRSGQLPQPQLVLWPENASDVDPFETPKAYAAIQAAASAIGVPILVGAVLQDGPDHASNTGIVWDPVTGPGQRYTKRHLVPFGEYIPFRGLISHLTNLTTLVPENFVPGHSVGTLQVGPATIADVMCFEVAFDEQVRDGVNHGGQVIVVQTNNATYMHTAETRQQLAMSQLRAIEHGRSVVIAATSGISAVIAPDGRVLARTSELTPAIIDMPVALRSDRTLADRLGAAPEWLFGILGMVSIVAALVSSRPRRNVDRDSEAETVA